MKPCPAHGMGNGLAGHAYTNGLLLSLFALTVF
jgi:hypothetical protein